LEPQETKENEKHQQTPIFFFRLFAFFAATTLSNGLSESIGELSGESSWFRCKDLEPQETKENEKHQQTPVFFFRLFVFFAATTLAAA
jgi:hypothetical protein